MVEKLIGVPQAKRKALRVIREMDKTEVINAARFVWWLTGNRPTIGELVICSGMSRFDISELLKREGMQVSSLPEVKTDPLSDDQHAFFKGLSYGGYPIKEISWSRHTYITVTTSSKDPKKHALLDVFKNWGEVRYNGENSNKGEEGRLGTVAYLSPKNFGFMKDKQGPGSAILLSKTKLPTFLLGVIAGRLVEQTHRLSLEERLRQSIMRNFKDQFGFPVGTGKNENNHGRKSIILYVTELGRVMDTLYGVESVRKLPFGQTVRELILPAAEGLLL